MQLQTKVTCVRYEESDSTDTCHPMCPRCPMSQSLADNEAVLLPIPKPNAQQQLPGSIACSKFVDLPGETEDSREDTDQLPKPTWARPAPQEI